MNAKHSSSLARHQAQCRICRHPDLEAIEQGFLDWIAPRKLADYYELAGESAIYRHAHALGLFQRRRANRLAALDRLIERVGEVTPTAAAIVAAIRLSALLEREAAASSIRSGKEIVLSFAGMPRSDAVSPRQNVTPTRPPSHDPPRHVPSGAEGRAAADPRQPDAAANSGTPALPSATGATPPTTPNAPGPAARGSSRAIAIEAASQHPPAAAPAQLGHTPGQNAIRKEPGRPQVAGFVRPWPPGKKKVHARRARWCCTGQGPGP